MDELRSGGPRGGYTEPTSPEDCLAHPWPWAGSRANMGRAEALPEGLGASWALLLGPVAGGLGGWGPRPAGEELGSQLRPHCFQPTGFHRQSSLCSPPSAKPHLLDLEPPHPSVPWKVLHWGGGRPPPGLSSLPGDSSGHALVPLGRRAAKATNPRGQTSIRGHGDGARAPEGWLGVQWTQLRHGFNE